MKKYFTMENVIGALLIVFITIGIVLYILLGIWIVKIMP